jgi:hypothetical protein
MPSFRLKRGTTAQNLAYVGGPGEATVDTTLKALRVHDGATAGGILSVPAGADGKVVPSLIPLWNRANKPSITSPVNGALVATTNAYNNVQLTGSSWSITGGSDSHVKSQWQVATGVDFTVGQIIYDSGESNNLTSIQVTVLQPGLVYYGRVRYKGNTTGWTDWSDSISFVNLPNSLPNTPSFSSPTNGATNVVVNPTLTASSFGLNTPSGETHQASQWQIATDSGFSSVVRDSGTSTSYKTSWSGFTALNYSTAYYARVRYQDSTGDWSNWSSAVSFTTASPAGEAVFTTPGTYTWTVPAGVTEVSVVCVGGGANGSGHSGGGGGGLCYGDKSVTPGNAVSVVVGSSGSTSSFYGITATGGTGMSGGSGAGGTFNSGGNGNTQAKAGAGCGAGGGGAGYAGYGGHGGQGTDGNDANFPDYGLSASTGSGGGGGGKAGNSNGGTYPSIQGQGGGGVGIYGKGLDGTGGTGSSPLGKGGSSGSNSVEGSWNSGNSIGGNGGIYGGGGGGGSTQAGYGGSGAVRIIWGPGRSFPNNAA